MTPHIKKLDIFILKSFALLFICTFFICLFIFMMQFLWKYVDEMVGKGLEMSVLAQFFFYSALTLVPVSLPLAVLLAALITFGNFGERFELIAMKAAGVSLIRIMRPLIVFITLICCVSFYFQNVIGPKAQAKLWTLVLSMKQKSPELDIPEGAFYDQIEGYNLYVKHKNRETGMLYDVLIYNLASGFENAQIIKADSGKLEMTADKHHLYLHLYSGEQFENLRSQTVAKDNVPYRREIFSEKHALIEFDSDFNMIDAGFMSTQSNSKNMRSLQASIDSMRVRTDSVGREFHKNAMSANYKIRQAMSQKDSIEFTKADLMSYNIDSILRASTLSNRQRIYQTALNDANTQSSDWTYRSADFTQTKKNLRRHQTAWHEKLTMSLACIIFLFIGAPLGGIIRKGGLGMPVVVSVLIFIFYYIVNNTGYKMARDGQWVAWAGMWLSTAVLAPIGGFLTYKSNKDSVVLNIDAYKNLFKQFAGIRSVRHLFRKEVIIHDPDYSTLPDKLRALSQACTSYEQQNNLEQAPNYIQLWTDTSNDDAIKGINTQLEDLVEEMSNSKNLFILDRLNHYPILSTSAHLRPFSNYWLNVACGVVIPVGLVFYIRIWVFRKRLKKDMKHIVQTNNEIINEIETNIL